MYRVTISQSLATTQLELARRGVAAAKLQTDLSTGVRIHRPSDDPRGQQVVLNQQPRLQQLNTQIQSISETRSRVQHANSQLLDVQQLFVQAKTAVLQGIQSTEPTERETLANEVDRLLSNLVNLANGTHDGEPLFGGAELSGTPFQTNPQTGEIQYTGSTQSGNILLSDGSSIRALYSGADVFQPQDRGETIITGATGAAAGAGTSSARGTRNLIVTHSATTIAGASGVQVGSSSAAGDTIIGPAGANQLTIDDTSGTGAAGTVSLNGGLAVSYTSADTNLKVTGPNGEIVYLDLSNVTAGFSGTADLTATGSMSVDGGLTQTAIDFTTAQGVIDSRDGSVTFIDSSGITRSGVDHVEFTETLDAFQTLARLRDELRNTDNLSQSDLQDALGRRLNDIDRVSDHLLSVVSEQSVSLEQLDRVQTQAEDFQLDVQQRLQDAQATDYASATISLQEQQAWMQFSLATISQLFNVSILNYL